MKRLFLLFVRVAALAKPEISLGYRDSSNNKKTKKSTADDFI